MRSLAHEFETVIVRYRTKSLTVKIPRKNFLSCLLPADPAGSNVEDSMRKALDNPCSVVLPKIVKKGHRVAVLVDDATRPTPVHMIGPAILERLKNTALDAKYWHKTQ